MKKILALVLSLCMVLSMGTMALAADASDPAVQEAYVDYIYEWLLAELEVNSSLTMDQIENEFMPLVEAGDYVSFPAEMLYGGMLNSGVAMTIEEFAAQYVPAEGASAEAKTAEEAYVDYIYEFLLAELEVNTGGMTIEIIENEFMPLIEAGDYVSFPAEMLYSGMLDSGVAMTFEEFEAQYVPAAGAAMSVEEAFVEYIHEWLLAEDAVNDTMTPDIVENEFMPLIEAGDYVTFPAEMLWNGMLNNGSPMTFEEFAAQYVPAAPAGGDTSETAYQAYLKEYVDAVPAVSDEQFAEFAALIDAGDYVSFPVEMAFNPTWWGFAAMTYDEFVAAGGVYEIPAFDPGLTAD